MAQLTAAGRTPTHGDTRCIIFGHLARMAVWKLREDWNRELSTEQKIAAFADAVSECGSPEHVWRQVRAMHQRAPAPKPKRTATTSGEVEQRAFSF